MIIDYYSKDQQLLFRMDYEDLKTHDPLMAWRSYDYYANSLFILFDSGITVHISQGEKISFEHTYALNVERPSASESDVRPIVWINPYRPHVIVPNVASDYYLVFAGEAPFAEKDPAEGQGAQCIWGNPKEEFWLVSRPATNVIKQYKTYPVKFIHQEYAPFTVKTLWRRSEMLNGIKMTYQISHDIVSKPTITNKFSHILNKVGPMTDKLTSIVLDHSDFNQELKELMKMTKQFRNLMKDIELWCQKPSIDVNDMFFEDSYEEGVRDAKQQVARIIQKYQQ